MSKFKELVHLFLTFLKIGLFTFGGGYAMISLIENECVEKKKWLTSDELLNCIAIAESTPGPIAINSATYIGYKKAGVLGAFFTTFGVVLPSFVIIFLISLFFNNLLEIEIIANAFNGVKVAVAILILNAGIKMFKKAEKKLMPMLIIAITFISLILIDIFSVNFSAIYFILIAGVIGISVYCITNAKSKKINTEKTDDNKEDKTDAWTSWVIHNIL